MTLSWPWLPAALPLSCMCQKLETPSPPPHPRHSPGAGRHLPWDPTSEPRGSPQGSRGGGRCRVGAAPGAGNTCSLTPPPPAGEATGSHYGGPVRPCSPGAPSASSPWSLLTPSLAHTPSGSPGLALCIQPNQAPSSLSGLFFGCPPRPPPRLTIQPHLPGTDRAPLHPSPPKHSAPA